MKRFFSVQGVFFSFIFLGILSGPFVEASRSKILVMGTGDGGTLLGNSGAAGSFTYDNAYNIFYNPSIINPQHNWGIIEKSNGSGIGQAQGGFASSLFNFNTGVFLNRYAGLTGDYTGVASMKPIDLTLGSDMGVQWGVGATYARADAWNKNASFRAGVNYNNLAPFFGYTFQGIARTASQERSFENIFGGMRYRWGEWIPFGGIRYAHTINSAIGGANPVSVQSRAFGVGLARNMRVSDGINVIYSLGYFRTVDDVRGKKSHLPIEISAEGDLTEWLTVRGGFSYREKSTGRIGASIHVKQFELDWAAGNGKTSEDLDGESFSFADGFFTTASVSYRWD